jgi:hypothetical protein
MPLQLDENWRRGAVDTETNSSLRIKSTPEIETLAVVFTAPTFKMNLSLSIKLKYPGQPWSPVDPSNPGLMVSAPTLDWALRMKNMRDVGENTNLVKQIIRMIGLINRNHPLSRSPFLWSDADIHPPTVFRMPSDEELLELSTQA